MPVVPVPCPCGTGTTEPNPLDCDPVPMCARFRGISGPDTWSLPAGVESFSVHIVCGQVTITDCSGEATQVNEGCGDLEFSAPGTPCAPGVFCTPFTIAIPVDSAVYVNYSAPCGSGV